MLDIFKSIFTDGTETTISVGHFLMCIGVSLAIGALYFLSYGKKARSSNSFRVSLAFLPAIVCVVVMMVNGNIGVGVAIAGAFSLVRFRSAQGTAKEICVIFSAMCSGLIAGVGYLAYAALFSIVMCTLLFAGNGISFAREKKAANKILKITIPEDLDYTGVFDDLFAAYTSACELVQVKTANMGSLYKLTYRITLKKGASEKEFMDKLRVRNGNLEILICKEADENAL